VLFEEHRKSPFVIFVENIRDLKLNPLPNRNGCSSQFGNRYVILFFT